MKFPLIRQLVIASSTLKAADDLKYLLNLGAPFYDKNVAEFGLENAVFAIGNQFLEIIAPLPDRHLREVAAGRFLQRNGAGGYMAIFQVADMAVTRKRIDDLKIRRVWNIDLEDISASHLHPVDVGAAILSIDEARPRESWRWAGPNWHEQSQQGKITGAILGWPNPEQLAKRWGTVLGLASLNEVINLDNGQLTFQKSEKRGLIGFKIAMPQIKAILERAKQMNLPTNGNIISFQGVELHLVEL